MFTDELVDIIVTNTNLYATQQGSNVVFFKRRYHGLHRTQHSNGCGESAKYSGLLDQGAYSSNTLVLHCNVQRKFLTLTGYLHFVNNTNPY